MDIDNIFYKKMAEMKHILLDLLGGSTVFMALISNWDNANKYILALLGIVYLILRIRGQYLDNKIKRKDLKGKK